MNRRSFLTLAAAAPLVAAAPVLLPAPQQALAAELPAAAPATGYLGTADGRIYRSLDAGQAWSLSANFGKHCTVRQIRDAGDALEATVETQGFVFTLLSTDGRVWRTPARDGSTRVVDSIVVSDGIA